MGKLGETLRGILPGKREPWEKTLRNIVWDVESQVAYRVKFSPEATLALKKAAQLGKENNSFSIDTSHITLALLEDPLCADALRELGVDLAKLAESLKSPIEGKKDQAEGRINLAPQSQNAIRWAIYEAFPIGHGKEITPLDLLMGVIDGEDLSAASVLRGQGIDRNTRDEIRQVKTHRQEVVAALRALGGW